MAAHESRESRPRTSWNGEALTHTSAEMDRLQVGQIIAYTHRNTPSETPNRHPPIQDDICRQVLCENRLQKSEFS